MKHITIKVPCKRYVKVFLELNCGYPVDLSLIPDLKEEFRKCLANKPRHRESAPLADDRKTVLIIIPPDLFYCHGWELNKENILDFNRKVEMKVKFFTRQYISTNLGLGLPLSTCIKNFQSSFEFTEDIWSYESIKKDWMRNGKKMELKIVTSLRLQLENILLDNLSELGTISKKFNKRYTKRLYTMSKN